MQPLLKAMGIRELVERVCPMEREHADGITHGQMVEVLLANRLVAPQPRHRVTEWVEGSGVSIMQRHPFEQLLLVGERSKHQHKDLSIC